MAKKKNDNYVGLDLGTDWLRAVLAEETASGLDIVGVGKTRSSGLQKGTVINIESTVKDIGAVLEEVVLMGGREVDEAYCNISGSHIQGINTDGVVTVRNAEVRQEDVDRVLQQAQTVRIPVGREIFHVLPVNFAVDENDDIKGPVGMAGVRLEAKVHVVTAAKSAMDNIRTCTSREGVKISNLVFSALAASETCLHEDEKELGVVLADIGSGTTDIVVWHKGSVIQTAVIPLGGAAMTNDIAAGLRTPRKEAEKIKKESGCALSNMIDDEETIEVPSVGGREPTVRNRSLLSEIIEPKAEEIFTQIGEEIRRAGHEEFVSSGLVLTGGAAQMEGMVELGDEILGLPVRVGSLLDMEPALGGVTSAVQDDSYAVALGMVLMAHRGKIHPVYEGGNRRGKGEHHRTVNKFGNWVKKAFFS